MSHIKKISLKANDVCSWYQQWSSEESIEACKEEDLKSDISRKLKRCDETKLSFIGGGLMERMLRRVEPGTLDHVPR